MSKTNKSNNMPFIITTDVDTKDKLLKLGFSLIEEENNKYTFLNDVNLKFNENGEKIKLDKMCYTNVMCMSRC